MVFVKHTIRKSTNDLGPGDNYTIFSVRANNFSDGDTTDATSDLVLNEGSLPPGKNIAQITGPVTIHGYSVRVFTDFFGTVQQGVSSAFSNFYYTDVSGNDVHSLGIQNAASDGGEGTSRNNQRRDEAVKNLKYIMGYNYQPERSTLNTMLGYSTIGMSAEEYAANYPKGLKIGTAHLQKKFSRKKMKHIGGGKYKKSSKSGFVLVPNTDTEFFSIGLTNRQHSESGGAAGAAWKGWAHVDCTLWLSYDMV